MPPRRPAVRGPDDSHQVILANLAALVGGTAVFGYLGTRTFTRRVLN